MSEIILYNDDCFNIFPKLEDNSIDLVLCDPPYGMSYRSNRRSRAYDKIENDLDYSVIENSGVFLNRLLKNNSALYIFCSQHNIHNFIDCLNKYFTLKNILVWEKNNHTSGDLQASYARITEYVLYYNKGRKFLNGKRDRDILKFSKTLNKFHPTEKPVDLCEYLINKSSCANDTVLDFCMGSGSTGVACKSLNRNFIGIEKEEKYYKIACERINGV